RVGLGWSSLAEATGATAQPEPGDLFASDPAWPVTPSALTVAEVDRTFGRLNQLTGRNSTPERRRMLANLMRLATRAAPGFLVRLGRGERRQGAVVGTMEEATAAAAGLSVAEIRRAIMLASDLPGVARAALTEGRAALAHYRLTLFRPIQPMLAQPAADLRE